MSSKVVRACALIAALSIPAELGGAEGAPWAIRGRGPSTTGSITSQPRMSYERCVSRM